MPYKHILFDIDGTLYDTYFANQDSFFELMNRRYPDHQLTVQDFDAVFGLPGYTAIKLLGVPDTDAPEFMRQWIAGCIARADSVRLFPEIEALLAWLKRRGYQMALVTSRKRYGEMAGTLGDCLPPGVRPYIDKVVCSDDVEHPKPAPDPILHYLKLSGARPEEVLYVGDTATDLKCADGAGVDFALALWGTRERRLLRCRHYLKNPFDLINILTAAPADAQWYAWAREIQAIGQCGQYYCHDEYDAERWSRLRDIAAEILAVHSHTPLDLVKENFLFDRGYLTPKVDTRAAIFNDKGEILMVQEKSGLWNLPGGWCEDNLSAAENTVKEVREEAGLICHPLKLIALVDRNRHNVPKLPFGALKVFVLCQAEDNPDPFVPNSETKARAYFARDKLPLDTLRNDTNTEEQLLMCFAAHDNPQWQTVLE